MRTARQLVLCLSLVLFATLVVFGGGETESSSDSGRPEVEYLLSINVDTEGEDVNDNAYLDYIEEKNDVDITLINAGDLLAEKLNTVLASGELPDYMQVVERSQLAVMADQGFILPLDDALTDWPNLSGAIRDVSWKLASYDDQIYAVPHQRFDPSPFVMFLKTEWLENLSIDPAEIRTVDDWYEVLRAFTFDDPDGNGEDDTFGWMMSDWAPLQEAFLDAFNGHETLYVAGELQPYYISDGYRDWLAFMARLVEEGIMDPEFVNAPFHDNMRSGRYGGFMYFWHITEWTNAGLPREAWTAVVPPIGVDGTQSQLYYPGPNRHYVAISATSDHPEKVLQILDWGVSDEGATFIQAGLEGRDHDIVNGEVVIRPDRAGASWGWRVIMLGIQKSTIDDQMRQLLPQVWGELGTEALAMSASGRYDDFFMLAPAHPELADFDLDSQMMEYRIRAILGQVNTTSDWDQWVADWQRAGGAEWIRLNSEWYASEYQ